MANISSLGANHTRIRPGLSPVGNGKKAVETPVPQAKKDAPPERLKDVVSVSDDGDTVQVSPDAENRLEEDEQGRVIPLPGRDPENARENEEEEEPESVLPGSRERGLTLPGGQADGRIENDPVRLREKEEEEKEEEEEEARQAENTSFVGYTDYQVEQMYLKGEISKQDYDQEMAAREEQKEAAEEDSDSFSRGMGEESRLLSDNERLRQGMNAAFSPEANNTVAAADRLEALRAAGLEKPEEEPEKEMKVSFN